MRKHLFFDSKQNKYLVLTFIFVLFWYFNYCFPLIWDDYVYSYVFEEGYFGKPLPETAQRVSCLKDIFVSQWNHYFLWGGRTVAHVLTQFFLWQGKPIFNVANAFCFVFILLEMQWIIEKGKVNFDIKARDILWLFSLLWIFSVFCMDVLTWLTLACNYLWTLAILLFFILIYIHIIFSPEKRFFFTYNVLLFVLGVLAGWTNENTVCFVILVLGYLIFAAKRHKLKIAISETAFFYFLSGFAGLVLGFLLLVLAPGNFMRYNTMLNDGVIITDFPLLIRNIAILRLILISRFLLYYYVLSNIFSLRKLYHKFGIVEKKSFYVSIVFLLLSVGSLAVMIFSPEFRWRSSFSGLIFLLISGGITRKLRSAVEITNIGYTVKLRKAMHFVICVYTVCTILFSIYVFSVIKLENNIMMEQIAAERNNPSNQVLIIEKGTDFADKNFFFWFFATGGHLPNVNTLSEGGNYWINKDVALYYGIKGIKKQR